MINIEYKLGLPEKVKEEVYRYYIKGTIQAVGYCHNNKIHLYGLDNNIKLWIYTIIHETLHAILDILNVPDDYHHKIIRTIEENYAP